MRIRDWSSDVCSSDLERPDDLAGAIGRQLEEGPLPVHERQPGEGACRVRIEPRRQFEIPLRLFVVLRGEAIHVPAATMVGAPRVQAHRSFEQGALSFRQLDLHRDRSEEHTSELQSLMRISYAVFCLKKKNKKHN